MVTGGFLLGEELKARGMRHDWNMKDQTQSPVYKTNFQNQAPAALPWDHGWGPSGLGDEKTQKLLHWSWFDWPLIGFRPVSLKVLQGSELHWDPVWNSRFARIDLQWGLSGCLSYNIAGDALAVSLRSLSTRVSTWASVAWPSSAWFLRSLIKVPARRKFKNPLPFEWQALAMYPCGRKELVFL